MKTQHTQILHHLRTVGSISGLDMYAHYRIASPTKRISELRQKGYEISGRWKKHKATGQRYMRYTLTSEPVEA